MKRILIFDTETTDLVGNSLKNEKHQPQVIEFYGGVFDGEGELIEELDVMINSGKPVPELITKITGIKTSDLAGAGPFKDHAYEIQRLIESSDEIVAHNLSFDRAMIDIEMDRIGVEVDWSGALLTCTVEATEWVKGFRLNLGDLHTHLFGEGFPAAHRAKNDVMALSRCFFEMRRKGDI